MRLLILPLAALVGFGFGCNKSDKGGGTDDKTSFNIVLPGITKDVAKDIKQGTTETYEGSLSKGSEFKEDVKLKVDAKPDKVTVDLKPDDVKASGDGKFSIVVKAGDEAAVGEGDIKITATPAKGTAVTHTFKIKVTKK